MNLANEIIELAPHCKDISILKLPDNRIVLIVICTDDNHCARVWNLLNNDFNLLISESQSGECILTFRFIHAEYDIVLNTHKTKDRYIPLQWLQLNQVQLLTTGIKYDDGKLQWSEEYLSLIRPSLN